MEPFNESFQLWARTNMKGNPVNWQTLNALTTWIQLTPSLHDLSSVHPGLNSTGQVGGGTRQSPNTLLCVRPQHTRQFLHIWTRAHLHMCLPVRLRSKSKGLWVTGHWCGLDVYSERCNFCLCACLWGNILSEPLRLWCKDLSRSCATLSRKPGTQKS